MPPEGHFGEYNVSARKGVARVFKLLLLPYPCLRHLVLGMKEIAAFPKMIAKIPSGQLETRQEANWAVYVAPFVVSSLWDVQCNAHSLSSLHVKFGPQSIASIAELSQVLSSCSKLNTVRVTVDTISDVLIDDIVRCIAMQTNRRLRDFSIEMSVAGDPVHLTDDGISHLVSFCPLMEGLTLQCSVRLTEMSMLLMHKRWLHTLRYLDISGSMDKRYIRLGEKWANEALECNSMMGWFYFDEGFAD